jgi:hypothetical protein
LHLFHLPSEVENIGDEFFFPLCTPSVNKLTRTHEL